jgi:hypothetical protein
MSKDSSERFLNGILGIMTMAEHFVADPEYQRMEHLDQLDHGGILSAKALLDQFQGYITHDGSSPSRCGVERRG